MLFRKFSKDPLELRHQRTSDAAFNLVGDHEDPYLFEYVYRLIETLLPKARYCENQGFKMIEMYSFD